MRRFLLCHQSRSNTVKLFLNFKGSFSAGSVCNHIAVDDRRLCIISTNAQLGAKKLLAENTNGIITRKNFLNANFALLEVAFHPM